MIFFRFQRHIWACCHLETKLHGNHSSFIIYCFNHCLALYSIRDWENWLAKWTTHLSDRLSQRCRLDTLRCKSKTSWFKAPSTSAQNKLGLRIWNFCGSNVVKRLVFKATILGKMQVEYSSMTRVARRQLIAGMGLAIWTRKNHQTLFYILFTINMNGDDWPFAHFMK